MSIKEILQFLVDKLDCSQKTISTLLKLSPNTLSNNQESTLETMMKRSTGKRLYNLMYAVLSLDSYGLKPSAINEIINLPVFRDLDGNLDSFVTANIQGKYPLELLNQILEQAQKKFSENMVRMNSEKFDLDSLRKQIA